MQAYTPGLQLFQVTLLDQSFRPTQHDRMVVWVEVGVKTSQVFFLSLQKLRKMTPESKRIHYEARSGFTHKNKNL